MNIPTPPSDASAPTLPIGSNDRAMTTVHPTNTGGASVVGHRTFPSVRPQLGSRRGRFGARPLACLPTPPSRSMPTTAVVQPAIVHPGPQRDVDTGDGAYSRETPDGHRYHGQWDRPTRGGSFTGHGKSNSAPKRQRRRYCWGRNGNGKIGNGQKRKPPPAVNRATARPT
ncbi:MAG: hypothetical protein CM15mP78_03930 [Candidatus Poseidoniales archaeon]|nr:MAG: hypothetical protein CM15mP78_03930 [Candidatus Poseidoniales archaeon]